MEELCCYGCGLPGLYDFKSKASKNFGKKRCAETYRSCPIKRIEGGESLKGKHHSDETKEKLKLKLTGRKSWNKGLTANTDSRIISGEDHPFYRQERSEQHKKNISIAHTGKILSDSHKQKLSKALSGSNNPLHGIPRTDEVKLKISKTLKDNKSVAGENNPNWNPDLDRDSLKVYRGKVARLTQKTYLEFKNEINPSDLPISVHGKTGYQIDHIVSVSLGFKKEIPPEILANKINLQMLYWKENLTKRDTLIDEEIFTKLIKLMEIYDRIS